MQPLRLLTSNVITDQFCALPSRRTEDPEKDLNVSPSDLYRPHPLSLLAVFSHPIDLVNGSDFIGRSRFREHISIDTRRSISLLRLSQLTAASYTQQLVGLVEL